MTREEAIKVLSSYDVNGVWADVDGKPYNAEEQAEAFDMAIEALEGVCFDEWCTDCKEYDTEKKCCPRFNRVIRGAMKRVPHEDGTLEIKVEDATKVGRVLISDDKHRGGLYYPDEDEPQGDLISRAEAIEAIENTDWYHQNQNKDMVHGANDDEHQAWYKAQDIYKALEAVPSADRQMVIKCKPFLSEEDFKAFAEQASDQNVILISNEAEVVSTNTSTNTSTKSTNISIDASADRPRGSWHYSDGKPTTIGQSFGVICDQCGTESEYCTNFCGECGADMRGDTE